MEFPETEETNDPVAVTVSMRPVLYPMATAILLVEEPAVTVPSASELETVPLGLLMPANPPTLPVAETTVTDAAAAMVPRVSEP